MADTLITPAENPDRRDLLQGAQQAINDLTDIINLSSPTNAQVVAAVRRLAQIQRQTIRRLIQL